MAFRTPARPHLSTTDRLRLFELHGRICHICSDPIDGTYERWEIEHVITRGMIGKAADTDDNMCPAHVRCHKVKTADDAGHLAKAKRCLAKHFGAKRPANPMPGSRDSVYRKRMDGTVERRPS